MVEKNYALIGKRLGHSYSARWFGALFARLELSDHSYRLVEMEELGDLRRWVREERIAGFNITVPYKCEVMEQLDAVDAAARDIGAVNCVVVEGGHLVGYNTDAPAFAETLLRLLPQEVLRGRRVAVLGSGGAARAVAYALEGMGAQPVLISRRSQVAQEARWEMASYAAVGGLLREGAPLVVNATPVGMAPDIDGSPIEDYVWAEAERGTLVYDLVYNPSPTRLMREAAAYGMRTTDGLAMLERQAELSWKLFEKAHKMPQEG